MDTLNYPAFHGHQTKVEGAFIGGFTGGIAGGMAGAGWDQVAQGIGRAVTGGVSSSLQGGKFGHGFLSAGVSYAASPAISNVIPNSTGQFIAEAVVGGTVSELTGGKFANGAVSSAMSFAIGQAAKRGQAGFTSTTSRQGNFSGEERKQRFEESLSVLEEKGLIPKGHQVKFDNRFAAFSANDDGSIASKEFFDSYDDLVDFTIENPGYRHLLGSNPYNAPRSTIYAGAANSTGGSVFGRGLGRTGTHRMTGEELLQFTIVHEIGHAQGHRHESRADRYALEKLEFKK